MKLRLLIAPAILLVGVYLGGAIAPTETPPAIGDAWTYTPAARITISHSNDPCQEDEALMYRPGSHPFRLCVPADEVCR